MKKFPIILVAALSLCQSAKCQLTDNGFYRVQNTTTNRYISIVDNKSYTQLITTSPDLYALKTIYTYDKVLSDPSTVFYIEKKSYNQTYSSDVCNIHGQGVDMYKIISHYLYVRDETKGTGNNYRAFAVESGIYYLCDNNGTSDNGALATNKTNKFWKINPFDAGSNNYFGVLPTVYADGKYFATLYCGFAYNHYSEGMKTYVVDRIWDGKVVIREVEGTVPSMTPVIIECGSDNISENRLDFTMENGTNIASNQLKGAMFNIYYREHNNRVLNDPNTIRVLGVCSDGKPGFITKSTTELTALPANTAYLQVAAGSPTELPLITYEEYAAGIDDVSMDEQRISDITTLSGVTVRKKATSTKGLRPGVFIWNKKKIVVK